MAARLVLLIYGLLNAFLVVLARLFWPRRLPSAAQSVCVYRIGNVGDTVCALPALLTIRRAYPAARLVLLTSPGRRNLPGAKELFKDVSWIDEIIEYYPEDLASAKSRLLFLRRLRACRFDVFIELTSDLVRLRVILRNMLLAFLSGARWAGGWSVNTLRVCLQQQSDHIDFPNEVERLIHDVARCGIAGGTTEFRLDCPPERMSQAQMVMRRAGVLPGSPVVAIACGAKRPASTWPLQRFELVAQEMAGAGFQVILLGSAGDWSQNESIRTSVSGTCFNLAGQSDLPTTGAILRYCDVLICNDSGPQHLASAVGTPCVAITSFWHLRGKWRAHHPRSIVLQKRVPCHTCFLYDCPNQNICLTETTSEEASQAAFSILKTRPDISTQVAS